MDPVSIGLTALIWWGVDWAMTPAPEPFRKTCTVIHELEAFEIGKVVYEPVFCDELIKK